jgi:putative transposase
MSFYIPQGGLPRFRKILSSFLQHDGLHFASVLPEQTIATAFANADADFAQDDDDVYMPALTLWAFLSQVLHTNALRSCAAAVARVVVLMTALGKKPCSDNTGAYCRARSKLPVAVLRRLTTDVAKGCEKQLPLQWLWKGRHVKVVDGAVVTMPDTEANQEAFPQPGSQAQGIGFPMMRLVMLFSLATAMTSGMAAGPCKGKKTGETALLRELFGELDAGDILLGDRYYCSYFMIAMLLALGIDIVSRIHQRRHVDFR